jgi:hypothetical protein
MSRDGFRRRLRPDAARYLEAEQDNKEAIKPFYRIELSDDVRGALARNFRVDVEVCATGERCSQSAHCDSQAHVKVIGHDATLQTRVWCADQWLAIREFYVALSGDRLNYGAGALNMIAMRRTAQPSDDNTRP